MRIYSLLFFGVLGLCEVSHIDAQDGSTESGLPIQIDEQLEQKIDQYITPMVDAKLFSGSILLSLDGQIIARKSYGIANEKSDEKNTPETKFKLMSTSKTFTAVAIMTLVQDGTLKMDDVIGDYLECCPPAWKTVTIRQLLSHTSNIPNVALAWGMSCFQSDDYGLTNWKAFAPEHQDSTLTAFSQNQSRYSNFNYVLLGLVIESTSGQPYQDYIHQHILKPARMNQTGFANGKTKSGLSIGYFRGANGGLKISQQNMSMIQAAGGLYSTVDDFFRFDLALAEDQLLTEQTRALMFKPITQRFGGGWEVQPRAGRRCVSHSGGANGYVADFLRFPDEDACVVVQSNFAFAPIVSISRDLTAILFDDDYETIRVPSEELLNRAAGLYREVDGESLVLVRRSGKTIIAFELDLSAKQNFGRLLIPYAGERFVQPTGGGSIQFAKTSNGTPGLKLTSFRQVREFEVLPSQKEWELTGEYEIDGYRVVVARRDDRFVLNGPHASLQRGQVIPVSKDLAIAIRMQVQVEFLNIKRNVESMVTGFTWHQMGGQLREATKLN